MKRYLNTPVLVAVILTATHCKGPALAELKPANPGASASATITLPADADVEFYQDFVEVSPGTTITVTRGGNDAPKGPPPYPGKVIDLNACWRWEVDVEQGPKKWHLSCDPKAYVEGCRSRHTSGDEHAQQDCRLDACKLHLPAGGPTKFTARLDTHYQCGRNIADHVLRIRADGT